MGVCIGQDEQPFAPAFAEAEEGVQFFRPNLRQSDVHVHRSDVDILNIRLADTPPACRYVSADKFGDRPNVQVG